MFNSYNPMQYLAIDIANYYGLDKLTYEDRIQWVKENTNRLEDVADKAEDKYMYDRAVRAFRASQQGMPVGHTVALDSVCSGMQLMSAMMGCKAGCSITGLVHENVRSDAYSEVTSKMNELLPSFLKEHPEIQLESGIQIPRKDAKKAVMTSLYGSKAVPKNIFDEDLLPLFYKTMEQVAPGAMELLELLRGAWNSEADVHTWELPDQHMAVVPVTEVVEKRINISDLNYTPVVLVEEVGPQDKGISLIANVVHSVDAYVLRTLIRRCSYHKGKFVQAKAILEKTTGNQVHDLPEVRRWKDTGIADLSVVPQILENKAVGYPVEMRQELLRLINMSLEHDSFDIVCVHDSFAVHPNHCNQLRKVYADTVAMLCDSTLVDDLLNQLYGDTDTVQKHSDTKELASIIRQSNYGIC